MSYDYLAKVGRDVLPLVEACRTIEVKVQHQVNRHIFEASLRREWEDALKRAETKLRQFVTLKDRLDRTLQEGSGGVDLDANKVPKLNVSELEAELAGMKERVGRHLTSLERLNSLETVIDREQERVREDEQMKQMKQQQDIREREAKEKQEKEKQEKEKQEMERLAKEKEVKEREEKERLEREEREKEEERKRKEEEEREAKKKEEEEQKEKEKAGGGTSLMDLIDNINDEVISEILASPRSSNSSNSSSSNNRSNPPSTAKKDRKPRTSPRPDPAPIPKPEQEQHHLVAELGLPVIDDEMEELRMRLARLEGGEELLLDAKELEQVEKSLQDDFERGLARTGGPTSASATTSMAILALDDKQDTSLGSGHSQTEHENGDRAVYSPRGDAQSSKIPNDPITPRTKREFERQDNDEEEADEVSEDKAGQREIKYLTLKKKPIPSKKKTVQEEEDHHKITFHEGEPPNYHRGGYLKRLERKALVKHKWQTRWMRLDSQNLSVYGSAAEASKDKSGKLALQQYRLVDLEEVALARNVHGMEIAFKLRFNDRQVLLSASTKNLMAKWMLAIDSVAHRRNFNETESAFITKLSQRDVCLRRLYLPVTEDGIISCIVDDVEYKWRYKRDENSQTGELVSDDGVFHYTWDAEYLRPKSGSSTEGGYGVWDGIWLTWYIPEKRAFVMRYQWHSAIEEFHHVAACQAIKNKFSNDFPPFRYNGKVLLSRDREFSWRVRGNKVPPPVVLSLQILYYQQAAMNKRP